MKVAQIWSGALESYHSQTNQMQGYANVYINMRVSLEILNVSRKRWALLAPDVSIIVLLLCDIL